MAGLVLRHSQDVRGNDLYETSPAAVTALLRVEPLPRRIWEPAAGRGAIVNVLRAAGHEVLASDLVDYGNSTHFARRDFLMELAPDGCELVLTNPPYKLAEAFRVASVSARSDVVAPRLSGVGAPPRHPRKPGARAGSRFQKSLADDAQGPVAGTEGVLGHAVRLVLLGPRAYRPPDDQSNLVGVTMTRRAQPEAAIQRSVIQHIAWRARPGVFAFHVPNGGWRNRRRARARRPSFSDADRVLPGWRLGRGISRRCEAKLGLGCICG